MQLLINSPKLRPYQTEVASCVVQNNQVTANRQ